MEPMDLGRRKVERMIGAKGGHVLELDKAMFRASQLATKDLGAVLV